MSFLEVDRVYSGIDLGGPDMPVPQQLLDIANISPLLEKMGAQLRRKLCGEAVFVIPAAFL
jgi:hypothetical protein